MAMEMEIDSNLPRMQQRVTPGGIPWNSRGFDTPQEKARTFFKQVKNIVTGAGGESSGSYYPSSSTPSFSSYGDEGSSGLSTASSGSGQSVRTRRTPAIERSRFQDWIKASDDPGAIRPRDWSTMLASPTYDAHQTMVKGNRIIQKVGFVERSSLVTYSPFLARWTITAILQPVQAVIKRVWSAGLDLLVQLSSPYTTPSPSDPCFLWNPLNNAFSLLPLFSSILNVITLAYGTFGGNHAIMALGTNSSNELIIEVLVMKRGMESSWQKFGTLSPNYPISCECDVVEWNGSFYIYSPPRTLIEITVDAPWIVYHRNIPDCNVELPRLVVSGGSLLLVDASNKGRHYTIWKYIPNYQMPNPWINLFIEIPIPLEEQVELVSVQASGALLFFFYSNCDTFVFNLENPGWVQMPNCPAQPTRFPIVWEEQIF